MTDINSVNGGISPRTQYPVSNAGPIDENQIPEPDLSANLPSIDQLAAQSLPQTFATPGIDRILNASQLIDSSDPAVLAEIQQLVDTGVISPTMTDDEIAAAIHDYFTRNYQYTPDMGADNWRPAGTTVSTHQGDCEDLAIAEASLLTAALQKLCGMSLTDAANRVTVIAGKDASGSGHMFVSYTDSSGVERYLESTDNAGSLQPIDAFLKTTDISFDTYFTFNDIQSTLVKTNADMLQQLETAEDEADGTTKPSKETRTPPDNPDYDPNLKPPDPSNFPMDIYGLMDFLELSALYEMKNFNPKEFYSYKQNNMWDLAGDDQKKTEAAKKAKEELQKNYGTGTGKGNKIGFGFGFGSSSSTKDDIKYALLLAAASYQSKGLEPHDDDWVVLDYGKMSAWQNRVSGFINMLRMLEDIRQAQHDFTDIAWQMLFGHQKLDEEEQKNVTQDRASMVNDAVNKLFTDLTTFAQKHNKAVYDLISAKIAEEAEKEKDPCKPGAEDLYKMRKTAQLSAEYKGVMDVQLTSLKNSGASMTYVEGMKEILNEIQVELTTKSGKPTNPYKGESDYDGNDYVDFDSSIFVRIKSAIDLIFSMQRGYLEVKRGLQGQKNAVDEALLGIRSKSEFIDSGITQADEKAAIAGDTYSAYLSDKVNQIQQWNNLVQCQINAHKIAEQMKKAQGMLIGSICLAVVAAVATVVTFGASAPLLVGAAALVAVGAAVGTTVLQVETMKDIRELEDDIYQHYVVDNNFGKKIESQYYGFADGLDLMESQILGTIDENFLTAASEDGEHFWEVDDTKIQEVQRQLTNLGNVRRAIVALQEMAQGLKDSAESALTEVGGYVQSGVVSSQTDAQFQRVSIGLQSLNFDLNDLAMSKTIEDQILKRKNEIGNQIDSIIMYGAISIGITAATAGLASYFLIAKAAVDIVKLIATVGALLAFSWSLGTMIGELVAERENLTNAETGFLNQKLSAQGKIAQIYMDNTQNLNDQLDSNAENALGEAMGKAGLVDGGNGYQYVNTELFKQLRTVLDHVAKMRIAMQMIMAAQQELTNIADATLLGFSKNRAGTRLASQTIQAKNQSDFSRLDEIKTFRMKEATVHNRTVDAAREMHSNTTKLGITIAVGVVGLGLAGVGSFMSAAAQVGKAASNVAAGLMIAGNVSLLFAIALNNLADGIIYSQDANAGDGDLEKITKEMENQTVNKNSENQKNSVANQQSILDSHANEGANILNSAADTDIIFNTAKGYQGVDHGQMADLSLRIERMARVEQLLTKIMQRQQDLVSLAWRQTTGGGLNTEAVNSVNSVIDITKQSLENRLQLNFDRLESLVDRHNKRIELQNTAITNFVLMGIAIALAAVSAIAQSRQAMSQTGRASTSSAGAWTNTNMLLSMIMNMIRGYMGYFVAEGAEARNAKAKEEIANDRATHGQGRIANAEGQDEAGTTDYSGWDGLEVDSASAEKISGAAKIQMDGWERVIQVNQEWLQAMRDMFVAMAQSLSEAATVKIGAKMVASTGRLAPTRRVGVSDEVNNRILRDPEEGIQIINRALNHPENGLTEVQDRESISKNLQSADPQKRMEGLAQLSDRLNDFITKQKDLNTITKNDAQTQGNDQVKSESKRQSLQSREAQYNAEVLSQFTHLSLGDNLCRGLLSTKPGAPGGQGVETVLSQYPQAAGQALGTRMGFIDHTWFSSPADLFSASARLVAKPLGDRVAGLSTNITNNMSQSDRAKVLQRIDAIQDNQLSVDQKNIIVGQAIHHLPLEIWHIIQSLKSDTPDQNSALLKQRIESILLQFVANNLSNNPPSDAALQALVNRISTDISNPNNVPINRLETTLTTTLSETLAPHLSHLTPAEQKSRMTGLSAELIAAIKSPNTSLASRLMSQFIAAATPDQALELLHKITKSSQSKALVHEQDLPILVAKASLVANQQSASAQNNFMRAARLIGGLFTYDTFLQAGLVIKRTVGTAAFAGREKIQGEGARVHARQILSGDLDAKRVIQNFVTTHLQNDPEKVADFASKIRETPSQDRTTGQRAFIEQLAPELRIFVHNKLGIENEPLPPSSPHYAAPLLETAHHHLIRALSGAQSIPLSGPITPEQQRMLEEITQLGIDIQHLRQNADLITPEILTDMSNRASQLGQQVQAVFPNQSPDSIQVHDELHTVSDLLTQINTRGNLTPQRASELIQVITNGTDYAAHRVAASLSADYPNSALLAQAFIAEVNQQIIDLEMKVTQNQPVSASELGAIKRLINTVALLAYSEKLDFPETFEVKRDAATCLSGISTRLSQINYTFLLIDARNALASNVAPLHPDSATALAYLIRASHGLANTLVNPNGHPPILPQHIQALSGRPQAELVASIATSPHPDAAQLIHQTMTSLNATQKAELITNLIQLGYTQALSQIAAIAPGTLFQRHAQQPFPPISEQELRQQLENPQIQVTGNRLLPDLSQALQDIQEARQLVDQAHHILATPSANSIDQLHDLLIQLRQNARFRQSPALISEVDAALNAIVQHAAQFEQTISTSTCDLMAFMARETPLLSALLGPAQCLKTLDNFMTHASAYHANALIESVDRIESDPARAATIDRIVLASLSASPDTRVVMIQALHHRIEATQANGIDTHAPEILAHFIQSANPATHTNEIEKCLTILVQSIPAHHPLHTQTIDSLAQNIGTPEIQEIGNRMAASENSTLRATATAIFNAAGMPNATAQVLDRIPVPLRDLATALKNNDLPALHTPPLSHSLTPAAIGNCALELALAGHAELAACAINHCALTHQLSIKDQHAILVALPESVIGAYLSNHCSEADARTLFRSLSPAQRLASAESMCDQFDQTQRLHAILDPNTVVQLNHGVNVASSDLLPSTQLLLTLIEKNAPIQLQAAVSTEVNLTDIVGQIGQRIAPEPVIGLCHHLIRTGQISPESLAANISDAEARTNNRIPITQELNRFMNLWIRTQPDSAQKIVPHIHEKFLSSAFQDIGSVDLLNQAFGTQGEKRATLMMQSPAIVQDVTTHLQNGPDSAEFRIQTGIDLVLSAHRLAGTQAPEMAQQLSLILESAHVPPDVKTGICHALSHHIETDPSLDKITQLVVHMSPGASAQLAGPLTERLASVPPLTSTPLAAWIHVVTSLPDNSPCHHVLQSNPLLSRSRTDAVAKTLLSQIASGADSPHVLRRLLTGSQVPGADIAGTPSSPLLVSLLTQASPAQLPKVRQWILQAVAQSPDQIGLVQESIQIASAQNAPVSELSKWLVVLPHAAQIELLDTNRSEALVSAYFHLHMHDSEGLFSAHPNPHDFAARMQASPHFSNGLALYLNTANEQDATTAGVQCHRAGNLIPNPLAFSNHLNDPAVSRAFLLGYQAHVPAPLSTSEQLVDLRCMATQITLACARNENPAHLLQTFSNKVRDINQIAADEPDAARAKIVERLASDTAQVLQSFTQILRYPDTDPHFGVQAQALRTQLCDPADIQLRPQLVQIISEGTRATHTESLKATHSLISTLPDEARIGFLNAIETHLSGPHGQIPNHLDVGNSAFKDLTTVTPNSPTRPAATLSSDQVAHQVAALTQLLPESTPATQAEWRRLRDETISAIVKDTGLQQHLTQHLKKPGNENALLEFHLYQFYAGNTNHSLTIPIQNQISAITTLKALEKLPSTPVAALPYIRKAIEELSALSLSNRPDAVLDAPIHADEKTKNTDALHKMNGIITEVQSQIVRERTINTTITNLMPASKFGEAMGALLRSAPVPDRSEASQLHYRAQMAVKLAEGLDQSTPEETQHTLGQLLTRASLAPPDEAHKILEFVSATLTQLMVLRSPNVPAAFELLDNRPDLSQMVRPVLVAKMTEDIHSGRIADPALFLIQGSKASQGRVLAQNPQLIFGSDIRNNRSESSSYFQVVTEVVSSVSLEKQTSILGIYGHIAPEYATALIHEMHHQALGDIRSTGTLLRRLDTALETENYAFARALIILLAQRSSGKTASFSQQLLNRFQKPLPITDASSAADKRQHHDAILKRGRLVGLLQQMNELPVTINGKSKPLRTLATVSELESRVKASQSPYHLEFEQESRKFTLSARDEDNHLIVRAPHPESTAEDQHIREWILQTGPGSNMDPAHPIPNRLALSMATLSGRQLVQLLADSTQVAPNQTTMPAPGDRHRDHVDNESIHQAQPGIDIVIPTATHAQLVSHLMVGYSEDITVPLQSAKLKPDLQNGAAEIRDRFQIAFPVDTPNVRQMVDMPIAAPQSIPSESVCSMTSGIATLTLLLRDDLHITHTNPDQTQTHLHTFDQKLHHITQATDEKDRYGAQKLALANTIRQLTETDELAPFRNPVQQVLLTLVQDKNPIIAGAALDAIAALPAYLVGGNADIAQYQHIAQFATECKTLSNSEFDTKHTQFLASNPNPTQLATVLKLTAGRMNVPANTDNPVANLAEKLQIRQLALLLHTVSAESNPSPTLSQALSSTIQLLEHPKAALNRHKSEIGEILLSMESPQLFRLNAVSPTLMSTALQHTDATQLQRGIDQFLTDAFAHIKNTHSDTERNQLLEQTAQFLTTLPQSTNATGNAPSIDKTLLGMVHHEPTILLEILNHTQKHAPTSFSQISQHLLNAVYGRGVSVNRSDEVALVNLLNRGAIANNNAPNTLMMAMIEQSVSATTLTHMVSLIPQIHDLSLNHVMVRLSESGDTFRLKHLLNGAIQKYGRQTPPATELTAALFLIRQMPVQGAHILDEMTSDGTSASVLYAMTMPPHSDYEGAARLVANMDYYHAIQTMGQLNTQFSEAQASGILSELAQHKGDPAYPNTNIDLNAQNTSKNPVKIAIAKLESAASTPSQALKLPQGVSPHITLPADQRTMIDRARMGKVSDSELSVWLSAMATHSPESAAIALIQLHPDQAGRVVRLMAEHNDSLCAAVLNKIDSHEVRLMRPGHFNQVLDAILMVQPTGQTSEITAKTPNSSVGIAALQKQDRAKSIPYFGVSQSDISHLMQMHADHPQVSALPSTPTIHSVLTQAPDPEVSVSGFNRTASRLFLALQEMDRIGMFPHQLQVGELVRDGLNACKHPTETLPARLLIGATALIQTAAQIYPQYAYLHQDLALIGTQLAQISTGNPVEFAQLANESIQLPDSIKIKSREISDLKHTFPKPPQMPSDQASHTLRRLEAELSDLKSRLNTVQSELRKKTQSFSDLCQTNTVSASTLIELATRGDQEHHRLINHLENSVRNQLVTRTIHERFESEPAQLATQLIDWISKMKDRDGSTQETIKTIQTEIGKYGMYSQFGTSFQQFYRSSAEPLLNLQADTQTVTAAATLLDHISTEVSASSRWAASETFATTIAQIADRFIPKITDPNPQEAERALNRLAILAQKSDRVGYHVLEAIQSKLGPDQAQRVLTKAGQPLIEASKSEKLAQLNALIDRKLSTRTASAQDIQVVLQQLDTLPPTEASSILCHIASTVLNNVQNGIMSASEGKALLSSILTTAIPALKGTAEGQGLVETIVHLYQPDSVAGQPAPQPELIIHLDRLTITENQINPMLTSAQNLENHVIRAIVAQPDTDQMGNVNDRRKTVERSLFLPIPDNVSVQDINQAPVKLGVEPRIVQLVQQARDEYYHIAPSQANTLDIDQAIVRLTRVQTPQAALQVIRSVEPTDQDTVIRHAFGPNSPIKSDSLTLQAFRDGISAESEPFLRQIIATSQQTLPSIYAQSTHEERRMILKTLIDLEGPNSPNIQAIAQHSNNPEIQRFTRFEIEKNNRIHVIELAELQLQVQRKQTTLSTLSISDSTPDLVKKLGVKALRNPSEAAKAIETLYRAAKKSPDPDQQFKKLACVLNILLTLTPAATGSALIKLDSGTKVGATLREVATGKEAKVKGTSLPQLLADLNSDSLIKTVFTQVFPNNRGHSHFEMDQNAYYAHAVLQNLVSAIDDRNAPTITKALQSIFDDPSGRQAKSQFLGMFVGRNPKRDEASQKRIERLVRSSMDENGAIQTPFVQELVDALAVQSPQYFRQIMKPPADSAGPSEANVQLAQNLWDRQKFSQLARILNISQKSERSAPVQLLTQLANDPKADPALIAFILSHVQQKSKVVAKVDGQPIWGLTGRQKISHFEPDPARVKRIVAAVSDLPNPTSPGQPNRVKQVLTTWQPLLQQCYPEQFADGPVPPRLDLNQQAFDLTRIQNSFPVNTPLPTQAGHLAVALITEPDGPKKAYLVAQIHQNPELAQDFQMAVKIVLTAGSTELKTAAAAFQRHHLTQAKELTPISSSVLGEQKIQDAVPTLERHADNPSFWADAAHFTRTGVANEQELYRVIQDSLNRITTDMGHLAHSVMATARQGTNQIIEHGGLGRP